MKSALSRYFPEQRVYIRTDKSIRFITLKPSTQFFASLTAITCLLWMMIATAMIGIGKLDSPHSKHHAAHSKEAYEQRLNRISSERDRRALEAQAAQEQFYIALEQISQQQNELLEAEEQRRELARGLQIMQAKLQDALKAHNLAELKINKLETTLKNANSDIPQHVSNSAELTQTLALLSEELNTSVSAREALFEEAGAAKKYAEDLQLNIELAQLKYDHIFNKLEDAIEVSLSPLERALEKSGINKDSLIDEIRRTHSGFGGPLTELTVSSKGQREDLNTKRFYGLLHDLDHINLLRIAGSKIPLSHPVRGSFRYTSGFGKRRDPKTGGWRQHNGADMAGPRGTTIVATADGTVTFAARRGGYGRMVRIRHSQGFETLYAHLNSINVKVGQKVSRGDKIGAMGNSGRSTGVHLHYEVHLNGKPINPTQYIKAAYNVF